MAWQQTIAGVPLHVQLLDENDPGTLNTRTCAEASDNILALAELAAHRAFVRLNVPNLRRWQAWEDATQEAALFITQYAVSGPRRAYTFAKKRVMTWIITQLWQEPMRSAKERQTGCAAPTPQFFSLEAVEGEVWIPDSSPYGQTPEQALLAQEEGDTRAECIEQFFDIAYDLVAYRMGIKARRHHAASNDAAVFQLTLRGYNYTGVAAGLGCTENLAIQRVTYARRRLAAFLAEYGAEVVAAWYATARAQQRLIDVRQQQAFVAMYVGAQEKRYQQHYQSAPKRRLRADWHMEARRQWSQRTMGVRCPEEAGAGVMATR